MAKQLKDILKQAHDTIKGAHKSTTEPLTVGKDPGVDLAPKAGDDNAFIAKHSVERWDEPYGNPNYADKIPYTLSKEKHHGNTLAKAKATNEEVSESKKAEDIKCNMSEAGTRCPMHEMADCSSARTIKELSTDTYHKAAHKAAKMAMSDVQGRSGPIFKKRAAQANKFRAKGMEQEKKEKATKSVKEETLVELSPATKKAYVAAATDDKKHAERQANHSEYTAKHAKTAKQRADFSNEAEWLKSIAAKRAKGIKMATKESVAPGQFSEPSDAAKAKVKQIQQKDADSAAIGRAKMGIKSEEVVNELSKKTLGSYVQSATRNALSRQYALGKGDKTGTNKLMNRRKGIDKAVDKLTKEEVIDEKHLTPAEMKKREEVAQAIHRENPKMPMGKKMAIATSTAKKVTEDLAVPLLGGDQKDDESAEMAKAELKAIANQAMTLVMQIPDTMIIEPWVQSKIAQAKVMVNSVHDYMVYGDHDKQKEAEGTMDTPMTFPNMSVDVNTGQNV